MKNRWNQVMKGHVTGTLQRNVTNTGEGKPGFKTCHNLGSTLASGLGPCRGVASIGTSLCPLAAFQFFCPVLLQVLFPGFVNLASFSGDCSQKTFLEKPQGTNFFCVPGQQTVGCVGCYRTPAPGSLRKGHGEPVRIN